MWDENHKNRAEGEWLADLQSLVLRDRNHPSVVIWSLCNEGKYSDYSEHWAWRRSLTPLHVPHQFCASSGT